MSKYTDITGKLKELPDACWLVINTDCDKWLVEFKDGTERVFKNVNGLEEVCSMINLDDAYDIYDV